MQSIEQSIDKEYWINYTLNVAKLSKDKSTKVGAVITDPENNGLISFGYNGMVRDFNPTPAQEERPEKYFWSEHAECNAIFNHLQDILSNTFIVHSHMPSMNEMLASVSSGIKEVFVDHSYFLNYQDAKKSGKYIEDVKMFERILELSEKTKTKLYFIDLDNPRVSEAKIERKARNYINLLRSVNSVPSSLIISQDTYAIKTQGIQKNINGVVLSPIRDAIFNIGNKELSGTHIYTSFCPCKDCSLAIRSVNFSKVFTVKIDMSNDADKRWADSFEISQQIIKGSGIEFEEIDISHKNNKQSINKSKNKM